MVPPPDKGLEFNMIFERPEWKTESFSMVEDGYDLCGSVSFYLCEAQTCTICLSRHSGLSIPYQRECRIKVQNKALCLRLIKEERPFSPSNTLGLSETLVSRGGRIARTL